jgi:hypothetical protein
MEGPPIQCTVAVRMVYTKLILHLLTSIIIAIIIATNDNYSHHYVYACFMTVHGHTHITVFLYS